MGTAINRLSKKYFVVKKRALLRIFMSGDGVYRGALKKDRSDEDLPFQVTLDYGIPLSAIITQNDDVFSVNDNHLIAYFKQVDTDLITEIAKKKPHFAVIRDGNFTNDSAIVNFDQVVATYSPNKVRKVL
jgi:adenine-specific DNA-methyltransferase